MMSQKSWLRKVWYTSWPVRLRKAVLDALLGHCSGRNFLAFLVTVYARRRTGTDVKVFFDEVWGHSLSGVRVPDSRKFCYFGDMIDPWSREIAEWRRSAEDCWCWKYKPQASDTVIDIGAGVGSDAFYFSPILGAGGRIFAIEANPNTYKLLTKLCEWNNMGNVVCRQCAIVDRAGDLQIEDSDYHEANSLRLGSSGSKNVVSVHGVTLDELIEREGIGRIDLIKMNIEGAEIMAIEGMKKALARARYVCIACHDFRADRGEGEYFRTRSRIEKVLADNGFKVLLRDNDKSAIVRDQVHAVREF